MTTGLMIRSETDEEPIAAPLGRVGACLEHIALRLDSLQIEVGKLVADIAIVHPQQLTRLQDLDKMTQEVRGVAQFLQGLAADANDDWSVRSKSAAASIGLEQLARELSGRESAAQGDRREDSDEFELFGN